MVQLTLTQGKKKILWGIGIAITIIVISIAVPLEEVNRNHDMSTTSSRYVSRVDEVDD